MSITTHCTCGQSIDGRCHSSIDGCEQLFLINTDNHYKMEQKELMPEGGAVLPANDVVQNWFEENIDKECSASSAIYKFRLWLESLQATRKVRAVWVKCWERKPDTHRVRFKDKHGNEFIGNYSVETGQYWAYGLGQAINDVIYWRPQVESTTPAAGREEDVVEFAEWAATIAFFDDGTHLWELMGEGEAINGQFRFTTKEFYQVFKHHHP